MPDMTRAYKPEEVARFEDAEIDCLPLTEDFLSAARLEKAGDRTGWVCGDYVFARALDQPWDYAWVVEPDLHFLNGAEKVISRLNGQDHDLIGTFIWPANLKWRWHDPLASLGLGMDVHAMSFPFVRMSRRLAEEVLSVRRRIADVRAEGQEVPNDESVVSSVAHASGCSILDLSKLMPDVFQYWSAVTRHNVADIAARENGERIVHSGRTPDEFHRYISAQLGDVMKGSGPARDRIMRSLESSSRDTVAQVLHEALSAVVETSQTT
ncbi:hypothetical protein [Dietzia sp. MNB45]|uniref:hypothetical protein n=1 Tax=Dietzia sp. MNB45 TaxID=3238800 RepID=UPI003F7E793F